MNPSTSDTLGLGALRTRHLTLAMQERAERICVYFLMCVLVGTCSGQISISAVSSQNSSASPAYLKGAPYTNVSKLPIASLLYPGATTKIFVRFMPWFGEKNHTLAGYESDNPQQIRAQIDDMMSRGISGAFIAWYGQHDEHKDKESTRFMQQAEGPGGAFQFALSYSGKLDQ